MIFTHSISDHTPLRQAMNHAYRMDETTAINDLLQSIHLSKDELSHIEQMAAQLVKGTRSKLKKQNKLAKFLQEYDLSSEEGIALMCLGEALLRIPDKTTIDRLISDKISTADWAQHLDTNGSLFVNAATWSLMLTGKILGPTLSDKKGLSSSLGRLIGRASGTFIRPVIMQGMKLIGKQFVMGTTIEKALTRAKKKEAKGYRYSYDMLGEGARTAEDAEKYFRSYLHAIKSIGESSKELNPITGPGISIKLSALHPRYELAKRERVMAELAPRLLTLAQAAKAENIGLTVDAEEADRLDLSLDIIEHVYTDPSLDQWEGFGLAVQAYQKRAPYVIDWLSALAQKHGKRWMVRLVKGAYWDFEIKQSQVLGLEGYPVFTRKNATDVSYIACAKKLLSQPTLFYSQFGTHNAHTVSTILTLGQNNPHFEFQCLHGMGEPLYDQIVGGSNPTPCRIYAPVGTYKDLLGYLVRRLLENGANTSFINHIADDQIPVDKIIADPIDRIAQLTLKEHPKIPLPRHLFKYRLNSKGMDLSNIAALEEIKKLTEQFSLETWVAGPIIQGQLLKTGERKAVYSPSNLNQLVGEQYEATEKDVEDALTAAETAQRTWANVDVNERAKHLETAANHLEKNMPKLITILSLEAGKTIPDCISEVREAVDFCRYYAEQAKQIFTPTQLPGPTGELNTLSLYPRGTIVCISPWNFPLAIFIGQIAAALVTGNVVIAKPSEQTPLIAAITVQLLIEAGIPKSAITLLPGVGAIVGAKLTADERVKGVMFTGSTETAKLIQRALANRQGPIVPLIAETGGQNAMIVDSSALPEQVVQDVVQSAFNSMGQRCSALRVLCIQEELAPTLLPMLVGAMKELSIGDPSLLSSDVGPIIDQEALHILQDHMVRMQNEATLLYQVPLKDLAKGYYFGPAAFQIKELNQLKREVFGPVLHIICYKSQNLDKMLDQIIATGYGLTFGIHSRIDSTINAVLKRMPVGNIYVNRNMIGAVVGVQPFGGERLSGTGPKAGGPHYLPHLCVERAVSINTTASGGNASLVSMTEDD